MSLLKPTISGKLAKNQKQQPTTNQRTVNTEI